MLLSNLPAFTFLIPTPQKMRPTPEPSIPPLPPTPHHSADLPQDWNCPMCSKEGTLHAQLASSGPAGLTTARASALSEVFPAWLCEAALAHGSRHHAVSVFVWGLPCPRSGMAPDKPGFFKEASQGSSDHHDAGSNVVHRLKPTHPGIKNPHHIC